uniref:Putative capsid protein n=1 Tax=viral metagenome TaxID=1070528 RepID=A0A6H1ZUY2_9ZZZZ
MSEAQSQGRGWYQRDIVTDVPFGVVDGTQKRDVSEMLDLLALAETPFINRVGWGPESGGTKIEWISEDLGSGKLKNISAIASEWVSFVANSVDGMSASDSIRQVKQGSVLYYYCSISGNHTLAVVTSTPVAGGTGTSITLSLISAGHGNALLSMYSSVAANRPWYVVGAFANEGSIPNIPGVRQRVILSNVFTILRQDVQITGTMQSTDMYAIGREDKHQVLLRLKELQRERERAALYSAKITKTSGMAGLMDGVLGFLGTQTGTHIDTTTKALTETAVNNIVSFIWEQGGRNLALFAHINQTAKFTRWDKNRIRMRPNDKLGGGYITSYMTESGIEIDLIPMANVPTNIAYVLDTGKIKLRAKRGRKALMEKLGKMGDFDDWQIISEFSMEMKGFNLKQHGGFFRLV